MLLNPKQVEIVKEKSIEFLENNCLNIVDSCFEN
jgi:hypothetical protein